MNDVYLPPLLSRPWSAIAQDAGVTVYVTEGELKAACACAHGLPCVGLGGVDVWRSGKRGIDLLETLKAFVWKNRDVVIAFDSDAATKPDVVRAQLKLAEELTSRGARPAIAAVPPGPRGERRGLDDLVVAEGADALKAILAGAPPFAEAAALHEMNTEVVYIARPGVILDQKDGFLLNREKFVSLAYAHRHYLHREVNKHGQVTSRKRALAPQWIQWPERYTLDRLTYSPGRERVIDDRGERTWNTWPGWGAEPRPGDVALWHRLLDHVFRGKTAERAWFERWCAYPLQNPGTKLYTAVVLWGHAHGTGKSFIGELLCRIYGDNALTVKKDDLEGSFNGLFVKRQFIQGEEITGSESRKFADELKTRITQESMVVREKYLPEYTIPTCANYFFTSNRDDAFFLDNDDRRFFVHEVTAAGAGKPGGLPHEFWEELRAWKNGDGPAHLFQQLLTLDLAGFNPHEPAPVTEAKRDMVGGSRSPLDSWCHAVRCGEAEFVLLGCDLMTPQEVTAAFLETNPGAARSLTPERVAHALKRAGFRRVDVSVGNRHRRLYAMRNTAAWEAKSDLLWKDERSRFEGAPGAARSAARPGVGG